MKKISLLIFGLLFFVSCSNDNEDVTTTNGNNNTTVTNNYQAKSGNNLKPLYQAMTASKRYTDYDAAIKLFTAKMRFTGNTAQINTEAKLLGWINTNIALTSFNNYTEAETEWNSIKKSGEQLITDNQLFFQTLAGSQTQDFVVLLPEPDVVPASNPCMEACGDVLDLTVENAQTTLTNSMINGATEYVATGNGAAFSATIATATTLFKIQTGIAVETYADCILACL
ncbi:hypothetical protein [Flavobacterium litorale]|uniref:Uncharacterized protein n=1 Tax=Flavobacterium litorale TaxID=2856519 RepID=A0ABX8V9M1_9FLAO|nr:hypothetical protein [Flavobacterium litorale]QYJ67701.1 hypothetical protein K1I41_09110 [Flavobacterium litorale]